DNAFTVSAKSLTAATLDAARMKLEPYGIITGRFDDDTPLHLVLAGRFGAHTRATLDGSAVDAHPDGRTVTVDVPAGKHVLVLDQPAPVSRVCASRRSFVIRLPRVRHDRLARARVLVNGRAV